MSTQAALNNHKALEKRDSQSVKNKNAYHISIQLFYVSHIQEE